MLHTPAQITVLNYKFLNVARLLNPQSLMTMNMAAGTDYVVQQ
jgi:hypothetical protein